MPWNYLSWKYCPFSAFLLEVPSVHPLDPIFPNIPSFSLWGPGRNWINKGSSLPTRRIPFSVPTARKGKSGTLICTNSPSQFCIASSCRNIQMQISADDQNSLCSLWTTRSLLSDFVFPRLLIAHEYFCSAQLNGGFSWCFIALFTFSWMFSWSVAQQTIN